MQRLERINCHINPKNNNNYIILNEQDIENYHNNGYLIIKNLLTSNELMKYHNRFIEICSSHKNDIPISMQVMKDISVVRDDKLDHEIINESVITKIQGFHDDEILFNYCKEKKIVNIVEQLIGKGITAIHTMLIHKPPNVGKSGRHPMHQDQYYFPLKPYDSILCCWTAMEYINRENGCLSVILGSHKIFNSVQPHSYPQWESGVNSAYFGVTNINKELLDQRIHLEMNIGDSVFFHPLLIHGSGTNTSNRFRKAISCHYASNSCHFISLNHTHQSLIVNEAEEIARKKGVIIQYNDIWRLKMRLITSSPIKEKKNTLHEKLISDIVVESVEEN